jgi:hypothetical protein
MKDSSPFHQTKFHPIGDIYTTEGTLFGLRKSDGSIIINFDQNTSYATLVQIARITQTEIVQVRGTWTFLPNRTTTVNDEGECDE